MRILIVTQAVDLDNPVLGFFHRWVKEFARQCGTVHIICLFEGRHELPTNVKVHSLGKESGASRFRRVMHFYRYVFTLRKEYDAVFVHMNPEYICLGGLPWRLMGKRVALWFVHWSVTWRLRVAVLFAHIVFTAREDSMRIASTKKKVLGHGIDTDAFALSRAKRDRSVLFLGRLDPVKRVDVFLRAVSELHTQGVVFSATVVGDMSKDHTGHGHEVRELASPLCSDGVLSMRPGVTNEEARGLFAAHDTFCNLSLQGHFDKTMLEAMSSGCYLVATNDNLHGVIPEAAIPDADTESVAAALKAALDLSAEERRAIAVRSREWVVKQHSLPRLIRLIESGLSASAHGAYSTDV